MNFASENTIKKSHIIAACLFAICTALFGMAFADDSQTLNKEETSTMDKTIIYADLFTRKFKGCRAELYVNGFPVGRVGGGMQPYVATPVPGFLVDGENVIEVVVGAGPTPATSRSGEEAWPKADPRMELYARLARFQDGEMTGPGAGEPLIELTWSGETEEAFPLVLTKSGDIGKQFGEWKWQSAEKLTLDDATQKSAIVFIGKIQEYYDKAEAKEIVGFAKFKNEEALRAYPAYGDIDFGEMFVEQMEQMKQHPSWSPEHLPLDQYDLRLVAGDRLIEAISKEWRPIVQMKDGNFGYNMYIGRIDGEWQILR